MINNKINEYYELSIRCKDLLKTIGVITVQLEDLYESKAVVNLLCVYIENYDQHEIRFNINATKYDILSRVTGDDFKSLVIDLKLMASLKGFEYAVDLEDGKFNPQNLIYFSAYSSDGEYISFI